MGKPQLFRMRSPCFGVQWVPSERHPQGLLLVSGGGGSAKSGVQNQILLAPFSRSDNPAEHTTAVLSTGSDLCTGMVLCRKKPEVFAALAGTSCNIYAISTASEEGKESSAIENFVSFQADFAEGENGVNSACFLSTDKIATAGQDGSVRVWQSAQAFPTSSAPALQHTFEKHSKPVMTIAAHPTKPWIASASRDGACIVWDVEGKKELLKLSLPGEAAGRGSICRSCAFTADGDHLFTLHTKIHSPSILIRWRLVSGDSAVTAEATHSVTAGNVPATVLQLSPDRTHLAVGMSDGSVAVFRQDDLSKVFSANAHSLPVTGLAFPPVEVMTRSAESGGDKLQNTLVSCSADYTIAVIDFTPSGAGSALLWIIVIVLVSAVLVAVRFLHGAEQPTLN